MAIWKKINRGVALTMVLIAVVVVYLFWQAAAHRQDIPVVQPYVEAYVRAELEWSMLPPSHRVTTPEIDDLSLGVFIQQQEGILRSWYIENETLVAPLARRLRADLNKQASGREVVLAYDKTILRFESIVFDGSRAKVSMETQTTLTIAGQASPFVQQDSGDWVVLERQGETWRVVAARLQLPYEWVFSKTDSRDVILPAYTFARAAGTGESNGDHSQHT